MKIEADLLRVWASAKMPDGGQYTWNIALPVKQIKRAKDPGAYVWRCISKLLEDFPQMTEAYIASKAREESLKT